MRPSFRLDYGQRKNETFAHEPFRKAFVHSCMPADYNEETFQIRRKILPIGTAETMENTTTDPTMQANHAGCSAEIT